MPYTPEQIAAFVGAAAWLPQIGAWAYKAYRKPKIAIIPDVQAEIGYSIFGPIFNLRLAVSADSRDVLLDRFSVEVRHEGGDTKIFEWKGTKETFNQVRDSSGIRQTVEKDETGIALKVRPDALVDKYFRFQDPKFLPSVTPLINDVLAHHEFLKTSSANIRDSLLRSDKLHALLSAYRSNFSWRAGKYVAKFHCKAIHSKVVQTPAEFVFELTPHNIEQLRGNFDKFAPYVEWVLLGASESLQVEPVFTWLYPLLARR